MLLLTWACVSPLVDSEATTAPDAVTELSLGDLRDCGTQTLPSSVTQEVRVTLVNDSAEAITLTPEASWDELREVAQGPDEDWWMLELVGAAPSASAGWDADLDPGKELLVDFTAFAFCIPELDADARPTGEYTVPDVGVYNAWPTWGPLSLWVEVTITE